MSGGSGAGRSGRQAAEEVATHSDERGGGAGVEEDAPSAILINFILVLAMLYQHLNRHTVVSIPVIPTHSEYSVIPVTPVPIKKQN